MLPRERPLSRFEKGQRILALLTAIGVALTPNAVPQSSKARFSPEMLGGHPNSCPLAVVQSKPY
jgi:hypothetical protein